MEFRGKLVQFEISGRDIREIRDPMSGLLTSGCLGAGFRGYSERFQQRFLLAGGVFEQGSGVYWSPATPSLLVSFLSPRFPTYPRMQD